MSDYPLELKNHHKSESATIERIPMQIKTLATASEYRTISSTVPYNNQLKNDIQFFIQQHENTLTKSSEDIIQSKSIKPLPIPSPEPEHDTTQKSRIVLSDRESNYEIDQKTHIISESISKHINESENSRAFHNGKKDLVIPGNSVLLLSNLNEFVFFQVLYLKNFFDKIS